MIVNVCPSGIANAPVETVWQVLIATERYGDWADAEVLRVSPPGLATAGQRIDLVARAFGLSWRVTIDVSRVDPNQRWIDLIARTPFGVVNREHVTLTPVESGRTLIRFN
jgi:ligand-binding SRPBCC domain-containing protein